MRGWCIVAGIFVALVLLLCVRARFKVHYDETLCSVKLGWFFFSVTLYPKKEKPKKKAKRKTKTDKDKPKEKSGLFRPYMNQEGIAGAFAILRQALDALGGTLRGLRKDLLIHNLQVYVDVASASGDAADTAILYGKACAVLYPLVNGIITAVRTGRYDVIVNPDYLASSSRAELYATVSLRPIRVLWELILFAVRLLWCVGLPIFKAEKRRGNSLNKKRRRKPHDVA
ncbi:MAG: DUF2953 domain-containing protein [Oscillospiraceae bacterium]|jgi:hypothetical protein|nr:DUF2953 domain-containing protein [Oscillospiraceae bacterium]